MDTKTEDEHGEEIAQEQGPPKKARGRPVTRILPVPGSVDYTDGCPGCEGKAYYHTAQCRRRAMERARSAVSSSAAAAVALPTALGPPPCLGPPTEQIEREVGVLRTFNDPQGVYARLPLNLSLR